ncbi:MAG TPA: hypothetical protein VNF68_12545, partial [Candidatus Baltobacteraceae bacterium]|nr:hypothetical protein [Candidatus Baltobacteraceae bacterium]
MRDVGPARAMPSGGLIAMGNVTNIARDVGGGLIGLTLAQRRFLVGSRGTYDRVVAIGDVFALLMALAARAPVTYVGTAKSVNVAPYGPMERRVLRRANAVFVRDEATAARLRAQGVDACAPGNAIVDLFAGEDDPQAELAVAGFVPALAVFPGSRSNAYRDARFVLDVVRRCASARGTLGAVLSIAPHLDAEIFAQTLADDGWNVERSSDERVALTLRDGARVVARAWRGPIGPLLSRVQLVLGQAGTANEAAAAAGIPVVAFERDHDRKGAWYRMRQHGLLGGALVVLPGDADAATAGVNALLDDAARRVEMGRVGRERMGGPGGVRAIARSIADALA